LRRLPVDDFNTDDIEESFRFISSSLRHIGGLPSSVDEEVICGCVAGLRSSVGLTDFGGAGAGRLASSLAGAKTETGTVRR
jgi:hypothetical protein